MAQNNKVFIELTDTNTEDYENDLMKIEVSFQLSKSDFATFYDMFKYSRFDNLHILNLMLAGKKNTNNPMNV